jgi:hypothetical protein
MYEQTIASTRSEMPCARARDGGGLEGSAPVSLDGSCALDSQSRA